MKELLHFTEIIKHLERKGWKRKNIPQIETVASHSWQMAMIAFYLSTTIKEKYDFNKIIHLCLIHDLAESIIGDITPKEEAYKNKQIIEKEAMKKISQDTNCPYLYDLFIEYEEKKTDEAKLANDLDKVDMYIQSLDYEKKYPNQDLEEFRNSAISSITTDIAKQIIQSFK